MANKIKTKQKTTRQNVYRFIKKNVIFGVQNSIQKNGKIYRYSKQKKHKNSIKKKNRKYIYVYL